VGWSVLQPSPPVPAEIAGLWVPGKINVVEFADFQCPFCRKLHPVMAALLDEFAPRVHFVRLNMPLPQHTEARFAARSYCCAEDQGKASEMADALFQASSLAPESCEKIAASLGLSMETYRECVKSAATDARIEEQVRRVRAAGLAGLPTVWIGSEVFVGLRSVETLRAAFVQAARGKDSLHLPAAVLWIAFGGGLLTVAAIALRGGPAPLP
jgi:protein-disulfide isomerase